MPRYMSAGRSRRVRAAAVASAVVTALVLASASPLQAQPATEPPSPDGSAPPAEELAVRTLTLVTGDRVTVLGEDQVQVAPREGVHFLRDEHDGELFLTPSDALPMLAADRLDQRLFNVSRLLADGFDEWDELPLMVADVDSLPGVAAGERTELPTIDGFATAVPVDELADFWAANSDPAAGGKIWLDGVSRPALDVSVPLTGAPAGWAEGLDGSGVRVAVLDTGIDDTHPDLAGTVVGRRNFVEVEPPLDLQAHGTHVAGTVAGSGAGSDGRYRGVAPGVELLDGKVCGGFRIGCRDSAVLGAMEWAIDSGAQVINLSLGSADQPGIDQLEQAINDYTASHGVLFVASAGNHDTYAGPQGVNTPSTAEAALSVANATKADRTGLYATSEFGPRPGDYGVKPEVAAPGENILAPFSSDTTAEMVPGSIVNLPGGDYLTATGTSMAAPHVTGLAALLLQRHPEWSPEQVKAALVGSAVPMPRVDLFGQGAGHVDLARAMAQPVTASPSVLNLGVLSYPHVDTTSQQVTYHNRGDEPVTLALSLELDAPAGLVELSAESVTVPAGGSAPVTVTIDATVGGDAYGVFGGRLVAGHGDMAVQTPVSLYREAPAATLRLTALDRAGEVPASARYRIIDHETGEVRFLYDVDHTLRLPMGNYSVTAVVSGDGGDTSLLVLPSFVLDGDREVRADARLAEPIEVSVPHADAAPDQATVTAVTPHTVETIDGNARDLYTADLGSGPVPGVRTEVQVVLARPDGDGGFVNSPYAYHLAWSIEDSFITGLRRTVSAGELATLQAEYADLGAGSSVGRQQGTWFEGRPWSVSLAFPQFDTPGTRTEYYNGGVDRNPPTVTRYTADGSFREQFAALTPAAYLPGRTYTERWLGAVLGPSAQLSAVSGPMVYREGDELVNSPTNTRDGAGHLTSRFPSSALLQLYRGEELLHERHYTVARFEVGPEPAAYRLRQVLEFDATRISTRTETEWTFESSTGQAVPPLTTIGFTPELRLDNSAELRRTLPVRLEFSRQGSAAEIASVTVEASFDDGATWSTVPVVVGDGRVAQVRHPATPGFVSLRGHAVDADGNTVTVTVIRAYEIK